MLSQFAYSLQFYLASKNFFEFRDTISFIIPFNVIHIPPYNACQIKCCCTAVFFASCFFLAIYVCRKLSNPSTRKFIFRWALEWLWFTAQFPRNTYKSTYATHISKRFIGLFSINFFRWRKKCNISMIQSDMFGQIRIYFCSSFSLLEFSDTCTKCMLLKGVLTKKKNYIKMKSTYLESSTFKSVLYVKTKNESKIDSTCSPVKSWIWKRKLVNKNIRTYFWSIWLYNSF